MGTILNGKYLSMPEQVQKNKNDIQIITEYIESGFKTEEVLRIDTTTIERSSTNIPDDVSFGFMVDASGKMFKIVDVVGDIVYLAYYTQLPAGQGFNYVGEFVSGSNEYYPYDLVMYQGSVYMAEVKILNTATPPSVDTTRWSLFVQGINLNNYYTNAQIDNLLNKKITTPDNTLYLIKNTFASYEFSININELIPTGHTRFTLKIWGLNNGGGSVFAIIAVSARHSSDFSLTVTSLGSKVIQSSFDYVNQVIRVYGGTFNYSQYNIEMISGG